MPDNAHPNSTAPFEPLPQRDRLAQLDILRGLALFGVLLVNLLTLFRVSLFAHMTGAGAPTDLPGRTIDTLVSVLLEFKAFTLFSLLFGVGIAIQADRSQSKTGSAAFLLRRFLVLLAIGLIHILFIFNGDILTLYAVCGLLVIPALRLPAGAIGLIGFALILLPKFIPLPIEFPGPISLPAHAIEATRIYAQGTFGEIFAFRWRETLTLIGPLLLLTLPKTLGVMLVGVAIWRSELVTNGRRYWPRILAASTLVGIAGIAAHNDFGSTVPVAFAYAAAVFLWIPRAPLLAAAGQMALTNYLAQSAVFSCLFYGFGLGWFGKLDVASTAAAGLAFYIIQLFFSRWWLNRFHFGPAEWLWRSLTYGCRQPFLRASELTVSHAGAVVLSLLIFLVLIPLIHGAVPWLLGRSGPHWGWTATGPSISNYAGLHPIALGAALLLWILETALREVPRMPVRVSLSLRPAGLLKNGPYALTRHPMYVAETLAWSGFAVFLGSPLVAALIGIGLVIGSKLVQSEERALESHFGDEYREYRKRVPVLPGLK